MKIYFTGSDTLILNEFPNQLHWYKIFYVWMYRLFIRLSAFCTEEYVVVHDHLIPELRLFGIKKSIITIPHPIKHNQRYCRIPHKGFNILYYCPRDESRLWNEWIYGYDIFCQVREYYKHDVGVNFIISHGQYDMSCTYPVIDFYLRPNRHDGDARMVSECKIQEIPYYWSYDNPCFEDIIKSIDNARR